MCLTDQLVVVDVVKESVVEGVLVGVVDGGRAVGVELTGTGLSVGGLSEACVSPTFGRNELM